MLTTRLRRLAVIVMAASGLIQRDFVRLPERPRSADRKNRKTIFTYARDQGRNRYTSAMLREIRATGQARECARRRGHALAAVA